MHRIHIVWDRHPFKIVSSQKQEIIEVQESAQAFSGMGRNN